MAVMEENKRLGKDTYLIFADAEKCFDKLWLEDCLVRMNEAGMREREVELLRSLNEKATIVIDTPSGMTEEFIVENIVKQGTVYGPQMCCVSTMAVNRFEEVPVTVIAPEVETKALIYVDDISAAGSMETIEKVGRNLKRMEERRKYKF